MVLSELSLNILKYCPTERTIIHLVNEQIFQIINNKIIELYFMLCESAFIHSPDPRYYHALKSQP